MNALQAETTATTWSTLYFWSTFKVDVTLENVFFHGNYLSLIFMPVINISLVTKQKCLCQMFL